MPENVSVPNDQGAPIEPVLPGGVPPPARIAPPRISRLPSGADEGPARGERPRAGPPLDPAEEDGGGDPPDDPRDRGAERRQALRRALYFALTIVAIALSVRAIAGKRGFFEVHRSQQELARLEADVDRWRDRNARLEGRIKALRSDPAAIETLARERLGWVRPRETTYLFPYDPAASDPGDPGPVAPGEFAPTIGEDAGSDQDASPDSTSNR